MLTHVHTHRKHIIFVRLPADGHLDALTILAVVKRVVVSDGWLLTSLRDILISVLLVKSPGAGLLESIVFSALIFLESFMLFSTVVPF